MYRVCYEKTSGRIIEMQSGGMVGRLPKESFMGEEYAKYSTDCDALEADRLQTLIDNAVNAGWNEKDIVCEFMDDKQYEAAQALDPQTIAMDQEVKATQAKMDTAQTTLKSLITAHDANKSKLTVADLASRLEQIEILLNLR
jgi:hypothetical protein